MKNVEIFGAFLTREEFQKEAERITKEEEDRTGKKVGVENYVATSFLTFIVTHITDEKELMGKKRYQCVTFIPINSETSEMIQVGIPFSSH